MKIIAWMMWQFGFGVRRRRLRYELEVVKVLRQLGEASHVVVDLIDLIIFVGRYLTIRYCFLLRLQIGTG